MLKSLLTMQETGVRSLGWEDPIEKGMTTHSGILAWDKEPGIFLKKINLFILTGS